ncbi:MAG: DNA gyrase inhibitor YacG [Nitrospira sp.]|nr:DNA gyrase inhibitor YacG [Nitrospira sp.]
MICPICSRPAPWERNPWRPFCSERCQITDLGAWALERYRIPGAPFMLDTSLPASPEDHRNNQEPV